MAYATAHTGGKSQINLGFVAHAGDYPFINCFKQAQIWDCKDGSGIPDPNILDADGYPTQNTGGQGYSCRLFIPRQADKPGKWILEWDGNGTMVDNSDGSGITGSWTSSGGTGFVKFVPWNSTLDIGYTTTAVAPNHIRNIRFYHENDAADVAAGKIFSADLKALLLAGNFGVIRFMDWALGNQNNTPIWAARKASTFYSYYANEFRGSTWGSNKWYFGDTTNVGNAYSITTGRGRAPAHGDIIQCRFNADATQSGTCSLNADGYGAINILDSYCSALSTGGNSYPTKWVKNQPSDTDSIQRNYATLVYDGVINAWIKHGGDRALPASGLANAVPPEMGFLLAAELGMHPWFPAPRMTMDPLSDYMPSLATYVAANQPSWMVPRYEGPNESFNNAGGFFNNGLMRAHQAAYGWPSDEWQDVYSKGMSVLGQALAGIYSDRSKYKLIAGVQTVSTTSGTNLLASTRYVAQVPPAQSGYSKTPASNYLHGIACANYYGPSVQDQPAEATMAAAYAGGDASQVPAYIALCYGAAAGYNLARNQNDFNAWKTIAMANGVMEMHFYEGGFSPDYTGDTTLDNFKYAAKMDPSLKQVALDEYAICTGISGGGFVAMYPSHYYLSANRWMNNRSVSVWALLEDIYQNPRGPQWDAIVQYNNAKTRARALRLRF